MKFRKPALFVILIALAISVSMPVHAQKKGMNTISAENMRFHLNFITADEFLGRDTPSQGLKIVSRYLAVIAESYGLKPLMPDGSYFQEIPLEVSSVSENSSRMRLITAAGEQIFNFPQAFGGRLRTPGTYSGEVVFVGYGLYASDFGWDDYGDVDLAGKVVVMLDGLLPAGHELRKRENRRILSSRRNIPRERGAAAVITVISVERETEFAESGTSFTNSSRVRMLESFPTQRPSRQSSQLTQEQPSRPPLPFAQVEIRHSTAMAILGLSKSELGNMFAMINRGRQVSGSEFSGNRLEISVIIDRKKEVTQNVVGYVEGSDSKLKDEYLVLSAHHDHLGIRNGRIIPGADDDGSGTVALLEIARALAVEKPKRSVILVWHTGEEKGLYGAHYFINHSPVPQEKISANINLDMLCRNDPDSLYLIASDFISTELDKSIHKMNDKYIKLNFDYLYNDRTHPDRFYYRSDHYPYLRFGIPAVWFFCGTTEDYHRPTDTIDRVDFKKMERVTKLTYLTAFDIGNMKNLLKLDVNPEIITRGVHNTSVESIRQ